MINGCNIGIPERILQAVSNDSYLYSITNSYLEIYDFTGRRINSCDIPANCTMIPDGVYLYAKGSGRMLYFKDSQTKIIYLKKVKNGYSVIATRTHIFLHQNSGNQLLI